MTALHGFTVIVNIRKGADQFKGGARRSACLSIVHGTDTAEI